MPNFYEINPRSGLVNNFHCEFILQTPVQDQEEVEILDGDEEEVLMTVETVKTFKTGQIMIEETDLGDDECIRTEYEIEEIEISN